MSRSDPAFEAFPFRSNAQEWSVSWHPGDRAPEGTSHGSAGICLSAAAEVVLISSDGVHWDFPAGRPEGGETWEETLRREVREEACASVVGCELLGFSRGECLRGAQEGEVLVRAFWRAEVALHPWRPEFEIRQRRLVPHGALLGQLEEEGDRLPLPVYLRVLEAAGII